MNPYIKKLFAQKRMIKAVLMVVVLLAALVRPAQADFSATFNSGFANGGSIPDGSFVGLADTRILSVPFNTIQDVNVRLNVSGGWNGDLYAYLVHNSGFTILLNRVGRSALEGTTFGYSDAGMDVKLDDQAAHLRDIHFYQSEPSYNASQIQGGGVWRPDGRNISPTSAKGTFDTTVPSALLSSFNGINPNGSWTLLIADVSGGSQATLTSWGVDIQGITVVPVPEPASVIEGCLAALFLGAMVGFYRLTKTKAGFQPA